MGKTMTGGSTHEKNIDLLTPDQKKFLSGILGSSGIRDSAKQSYKDFLQPYDPQQYQDVFQKSVVDPTMQTYNQQIVPGIQQRFVDANAGSSSALNQALGQSANDLGTMLGGQYLDFFKQQQANQLSALSGIGGLAGQQTFTPMISQKQGILGPLIGAAGTIGAAAVSSEKVKENVRDYKKGLDVIKNLEVKIYDYIESVGGAKDKVGVMAEKVPSEIQGEIQGIKAVDLYGLIGLLINSVKELNERIVHLEEAI